MKKISFCGIVFLFCAIVSLHAQHLEQYYAAANGLSSAGLKTALAGIINPHHELSYDTLWQCFYRTDLRSAGNYVWDMYSDCHFVYSNDQCGNYKNICDCYNREHSFPQSWFTSRSAMATDLHHIYPTDGKVNNMRGSYPLGECSSGTVYGLGKLGNCTFSGYSDVVFEPADEYKGDFARTYFYVVTCYENEQTLWPSSAMINNTAYPSFNTWSLNLLLKWHRQDPVSNKEINRNNAVYAYQYNRNPFIDYPVLAEYIWGDSVGQPWNLLPTDDSTRIEEIAFTIDVYPNPFNDMLTINTNEPTAYQILDICGRTLQKGIVENGTQLDLSHFSNNVYCLLLTRQNGLKVYKKIVKQKKD